MKRTIKQLQADYQRIAKGLARTGWISHGYVQDRGPGAGGPCYQWTRKERRKTISVALSKDQYLWMRKAIANWRRLQLTLERMEQISRTVMLETVPDTRRRKPLSRKVMDTI
jgi:hypothetical protein